MTTVPASPPFDRALFDRVIDVLVKEHALVKLAEGTADEKLTLGITPRTS